MDPSSNVSPSRSPEPASTELEEDLLPLGRLREALDPERESVERIVRAALGRAGGEPEGRTASRRDRPGPFRLAGALAATTALAVGLILALPGRQASLPGEPKAARISITNQGGVVLAWRSEGSGGWIVRSGPAVPAASSQIILVLHGDRP